MMPNHTIFAERVLLTSSFYQEYLGFKLNHWNQDFSNPMVSLDFNGQEVIICSQKSSQTTHPVYILISDIAELYEGMHPKVFLRKRLSRNSQGQYEFSIADCEGNTLNFLELSSPPATVQNQPSITNELAETFS